MFVSKYVTCFTIAASFFALGCQSLPEFMDQNCEWGWREVNGELVYGYWCDGTFHSTNDADQWGYFVDPSLLTVDTSGSNMQFNTHFGTGRLTTFDLQHNPLQTETFTWTKNGSSLVNTSPGVVTNAINQSLGQAIRVEYGFDGIGISPQVGLNVLDGVLSYSGQGVIASQISWYCNGGGGGPLGGTHDTLSSCSP